MEKIILNLPREIKLGILRDTLKDNKFDEFLAFSKILLNAPISEGGIETETIEAIRKEFYND